MKKLHTILVALLITATTFAQVPEKMSYQAVVRDASGALVSEQVVGMRIQIIQGSEFGASVYVETQTPTTNANGLVTLEIGAGTVITGSFNSIEWDNGPYFIETETDPTGGSNYSIIGNSQLLSVPYALYAKYAENPGPQGPAGNDGAVGATGPQGPAGADGQGGVTTAGTNVTITGSGTSLDPYVVNAASGTCGLSIGDTYQGGIIFYLDASGCHGLIAAPTDQSAGIQWYNGSYTNTTAFGSCVGCGDGNTSAIVYSQGAGSYAAKICYDLFLGGYSDWYLPSKYELNLMYENIGQGNALGLGNVGGFADFNYWSSTENDTNNAWFQGVYNGLQNYYNKNSNTYVRAIRVF